MKRCLLPALAGACILLGVQAGAASASLWPRAASITRQNGRSDAGGRVTVQRCQYMNAAGTRYQLQLSLYVLCKAYAVTVPDSTVCDVSADPDFDFESGVQVIDVTSRFNGTGYESLGCRTYGYPTSRTVGQAKTLSIAGLSRATSPRDFNADNE
jgi:hypothetical protein